MSSPETITRQQLNYLHSLWNLYVTDGGRVERLKWASRNLGREINSFNDLTKVEAKTLIDVAQMGLERVP